jgi:Predicted redox protein, regulator of disulfide bond formation
LKKLKRQFDLKIEVKGKRADEHPKVYTEIFLTYEVSGDVLEKELLRAVSLSLNKYCSVSAMISKSCPIFYKVFLNGREIGNGKKG